MGVGSRVEEVYGEDERAVPVARRGRQGQVVGGWGVMDQQRGERECGSKSAAFKGKRGWTASGWIRSVGDAVM